MHANVRRFGWYWFADGIFVLAICAGAMAWPACALAADGKTEAPVASFSQPLFGPPFYSGGILPTPQWQRAAAGEAVLLDGAERRLGYRLQVGDDIPAKPLLERLFAQRIEQFRRMHPGEWAARGPTVEIRCILAGEAEKLGIFPQSLPVQGYQLCVRPHAITCIGADNQGLTNAMASLLQLLHDEHGRLCAASIDVRDFPAFQQRFVAEYHFPAGTAFYDWLALYKINGFATGWKVIDWRGLSPPLVVQMETTKEYCRRYQTLQYMAQIHLGGRADRARIDLGNPTDIQRLLQTITETLVHSGATHVMLLSDDISDCGLTMPREKERFSSLGAAHAALIVQVREELRRHFPQVALSFCAPHYQGLQHRRWSPTLRPQLREQALEYVRHVPRWPADVPYVWTGPVTESRRITDDDIAVFQRLVGGHALLYWDNTWHYHQPLRNFHAQYPPQFVKHCAGALAFLHINGESPLGRFFAATALDYYWNPDAFDSRRAQRAAVTQFMGAAALPATERLSQLRGDDYFSRWASTVDLDALAAIIRELDATARDRGIVDACWSVYNGIATRRKAPSAHQ